VYERLPAEFGDSFVTSTLLEERHSSDGTTTKLLFEMQDGLRVEVRIQSIVHDRLRTDHTHAPSTPALPSHGLSHCSFSGWRACAVRDHALRQLAGQEVCVLRASSIASCVWF
jgi:hypothetical protein